EASEVASAPTDAHRRLLDAAERQVLESGPRHLDLAAVAREAGLPESLVARHFPTREVLAEELVLHMRERFEALLARVRRELAQD
ncbi:MAG TPA: TetR family transcriptional regulator, partial [Planctomycetota bacterium]|nr:TetR family transcriptional regulator [Planctomycetota bacterium]